MLPHEVTNAISATGTAAERATMRAELAERTSCLLNVASYRLADPQRFEPLALKAELRTRLRDEARFYRRWPPGQTQKRLRLSSSVYTGNHQSGFNAGNHERHRVVLTAFLDWVTTSLTK